MKTKGQIEEDINKLVGNGAILGKAGIFYNGGFENQARVSTVVDYIINNYIPKNLEETK